VNNAGTNVRKPALEATPDEYTRITSLNLDAVYHLCVGAHPLLIRSSRPTIVNVASAAGLQSTGSGAAYAVSKAGVVQLTKTLACEW
jgi:Tropinone reductase 1